MVHVYRLSESARENVSAASKIATEVLLPNAADVDTQGRYPAESLKALADAGLYGLCLRGDLGGMAEGMRAFAGVVEELSGACASTALVYVMHVPPSQTIATSSTLGDRDCILRAFPSGTNP